MPSFAHLSREEQVGLLVAGVAHAALLAVLMLQDDIKQPVLLPERMDVSLATEVSLESTAPDPSAEPAAALAPTLSDEVAPEPLPPIEKPIPEAVEQPVQPQPVPRPQPTRSERRTTPSPTPTPRATQSQAPRPQPTRTSGASRIGSDFLEGKSDANGDRGTPASRFGPTEQAALSSAITRQLRPKWQAPSGVDVDKLVTVIAWELNPDGSLKGTPRLVSQTGVNDSNQPQASVHVERAIRAIQLAAPFNLPEQYYDNWRRLQWTFDRRL